MLHKLQKWHAPKKTPESQTKAGNQKKFENLKIEIQNSKIKMT